MTSKKYDYEIPANANHAAKIVAKWVERESDVLEIGCASGIQTRIFKESLGCRVTGLEIDPLAAEDARPYCESLIIGNVAEIDLSQAFGDCRFDVILFVDVLEHLVDPTAALKRVQPYLKEKGYLIASIPNIAHAVICWEIAHGRFDYQKYGLLDDTHIRFFTKKNVVRLFEDAGYEIIALDRVIKKIQETEFDVHCSSAQDQNFLDWVCENNKEALTYQFVIKAQPILDKKVEFSYQYLDALDKLRHFEAIINENNKLKSQISWLENHRFGILSTLIDRIRNYK
jgi:2-polyprenyl-3-methyl-5-hydroxy-6-metoxy-1,4-benzoquinol methylase